MESNCSWPAVSVTDTLTFSPANSKYFTLKSTPIVATPASSNSPSKYCLNKDVFPTPEDPKKIILISIFI